MKKFLLSLFAAVAALGANAETACFYATASEPTPASDYSKQLPTGTVAGNTYTAGNVSIEFVKVNNTPSQVNSNLVRWYANDKIIIKGLDGSKITNVVIAASSTSYAGAISKTVVDDANNTIGNASVSGSTFSWEYAAGSNSVTITNTAQVRFSSLTVTYAGGESDPRQDASLTFTGVSDGKFTVNLGEEFTSPVATAFEGAVITYSIDNDEVAEINPNTGELTLKAGGEAEVTAHSAETDAYKEGSASYTLIVIDPNKLDASFDFTVSTKYSNGTAYSSLEEGIVTLTFDKSSGSTAPAWYSSGTAMRFYANNTLKVSVPNGYYLTKIEFGFSQNSWASASSGSWSSPTWTTGTDYVSEVTFTNGSSQTRVQKITVHYAASTDPEKGPAPEISFDEVTETVTITSEIEGASIYYTLDGEDPTAESTLYEAPFTVEKTCTVKAVAVKDGELSNVAVVNVTIPLKAKNIAEMLELAPATGNKIIVDFEMTVVYANGRYVYVTDAEGNATLLYGLTTDYKAGDVIPARWEATTNLYNGLVEFSGSPAASTSKAEYSYPTVETITEADVNRVVIVSNVTFAEETLARTTESGSAANFEGTLSDGTTMTFRTNFPIDAVEAGKYNVTAAVGIYNTTLQLFPISYEAIVLEPCSAPFIIGGPKEKGEYYQDGEQIVLSCAADQAIYFTLDGSDIEIPGYGTVKIGASEAAAAPRKALEAAADPTDNNGYSLTGTNKYIEGQPIVFQKDNALDLNFVAYQEGMAPSEVVNLSVAADGETTGIENVAVDAANAPVEYYNLQGIRVAEPSNGIFIRRQGNTVAKILVK